MSGADSFFDTSVLLYLLSGDSRKADRAEQLLAESGVISVQVLNEFTVVAYRKLAMPLADIREVLNTIRSVCRTEPLTVEGHDQAVSIMERYRFSLYDSFIVASALQSGCKTLYAEDLQHRQIVDRRLTIINPFAG